MDWDSLINSIGKFDGDEFYFSLTIDGRDGTERTISLVAEIENGRITRIHSTEDNGPCLDIDFNHYEGSVINKTRDCFSPTLQAGYLTILQDIKLQLIRNIDNPAEIYLIDVALIPQQNTMLSAYNLVRGKPMAYEKFGFAPTNWLDLDTFKDKLQEVTFGELSPDLQQKIGRKINQNANVSQVMNSIPMQRDNEISHEILEEVLQLCKDESDDFEQDLEIGDGDNENSIYYQSLSTSGDPTETSDGNYYFENIISGWSDDNEYANNGNNANNENNNANNNEYNQNPPYYDKKYKNMNENENYFGNQENYENNENNGLGGGKKRKQKKRQTKKKQKGKKQKTRKYKNKLKK
jgi:hypothetical protein